MNLAILISNAGTGSNLKAISDAIEQKKLHATIAVVMSDSADAYGLIHAKKHHIPIHIFNAKQEKLEAILTQQFSVDYLVLAGWKKIVTDETRKTFPDKILNIHPGLIPDALDGVVKNPDGTDGFWNRGKFTTAAIQNFLDNKATYAGSTIHFLSNEFDFGRVLGRCFEKVVAGDTVDSLYRKLKRKENEMYVRVLKKLS